MTNPSNQTNPLDYPAYVRGMRPSLPQSIGDYVDTELEKIQNTFPNLAVAADANTKTQVNTVQLTADAKSTIYWQSTAPTGGTYKQGDCWIDIGNNNQLNTWDPTANSGAGGWVLAQDQGIPQNAAAITSEQTARLDGDNANATDITNLTTTVNGNSASITTLQNSVNGIQAQYGVTLNVNGYITGFTELNDGKTGSFIITASDFAIIDPSAPANQPGTVPFQVSGGVVTIDNAVIENLTVDKLAGGVLNTGSTPITQNSDINLGTGHIVFDNGSAMRVQGVGFGSSNQFIDWFGPHQAAFSDCTEANATFYLKTDGSAYFGGSLSAGTLRSSAQTTNTASNASISVGPFSSNGGNITALISYSYNHTYTCTQGTSTGNGTSTTTTSLALQNSTDSGGTFSTLATLPITITCSVTQPGDGKDHVSIHGGGSTTVTWNPGALTTLELQGSLTAFASPVGGGSGIANNVITQNITVSSTE
jgi:hypothetical protein